MWKKEQAAALCVFMIGGVGALLAVIGILLAFRQKRKIRNCTSYTTGWVVRHCFPGEEECIPWWNTKWGERYIRFLENSGIDLKKQGYS